MEKTELVKDETQPEIEALREWIERKERAEMRISRAKHPSEVSNPLDVLREIISKCRVVPWAGTHGRGGVNERDPDTNQRSGLLHQP